MNRRTLYLSILDAKSCGKQSFFKVLTPENSWLSGSCHTYGGDLEVSGVITYSHGVASVSGSVRVPMQFICDRCGTQFSKNLLASFAADYCEIDDYENPTEIEMEYKIVSNQIDILPFVRDAVIENLPSKVLCKQNCKGLCPVCGENLNFSACRCKN